MINVTKLSPGVIADVTNRLIAMARARSKEEALVVIQNMTPEEVFTYWLEWQGICGWAPNIIRNLDSIRAAKE